MTFGRRGLIRRDGLWWKVFIRGVAFGERGHIRGVAFGGRGLIRGVGGLWWEGSYKRDRLWWNGSYKRDGL